MLSKFNKIEISNVCYAMVSGAFSDMINPRNRGRNFSWSDFSRDMAERCRDELHLYIIVPEGAKGRAMTSLAESTAREIAERMVSRAGLELGKSQTL